MFSGLQYYMSLKYPVEITPIKEEEGGGFLAEIKLLKGCMSDGETVDEAMANIQDAKESWLTYMLEKGYDIPEPDIELEAGCDALFSCLTDFKKLMLTAPKLKAACEEVIKYYEQIRCDLMHYCEINFESMSKDKCEEICKLMFIYSKKRRKAKDILDMVSPFASYMAGHQNVQSDLGKIANDVIKVNTRAEGSRRYKPKVLVSLFKEE